MRNNIKILKYFFDNPNKEFSTKMLVKALNINRHSLLWAMVDLLVIGFVVENKGRPNLYKLHEDFIK